EFHQAIAILKNKKNKKNKKKTERDEARTLTRIPRHDTDTDTATLLM
ncbi:hypothetical protein A2U01_0080778, partial [Trifolium medium]|nr:hypothetical protein [Trifolium medium]